MLVNDTKFTFKTTKGIKFFLIPCVLWINSFICSRRTVAASFYQVWKTRVEEGVHALKNTEKGDIISIPDIAKNWKGVMRRIGKTQLTLKNISCDILQMLQTVTKSGSSEPYRIGGFDIQNVIVVGKYSQTESFFPESGPYERLGLLKASAGGYYDWEGRLVNIPNEQVASSFIILANISTCEGMI